MKFLTFLLLPVACSAALTKPDLEPTLLAVEGEDAVPAARISWNPKYRGAPRGAWQFHAQLDLKSTLATKAKANDEPTVLDVRGGLRWDPAGDVGPTRVFGGGEAPRNGTSFPGSFAFEAAAAFEGDQAFDDRQWAVGVRLNYTPDDVTDVRRWWHPYVWVEYRRVTEVGSDLATRLRVSEQDYWRFGARIYWQVALSELGVTGFWKSLKIVPGVEYHRSTDLAVAVGDLADAWHRSLAFDYAMPPEHPWLSAVRVKFSEGRLPPSTESRTSVSIAIAVKWDRLFD